MIQLSWIFNLWLIVKSAFVRFVKNVHVRVLRLTVDCNRNYQHCFAVRRIDRFLTNLFVEEHY